MAQVGSSLAHLRTRDTEGASPPKTMVLRREQDDGVSIVVRTEGVHTMMSQSVTVCKKSEVVAIRSSAPLQSVETVTPVQAVMKDVS